MNDVRLRKPVWSAGILQEMNTEPANTDQFVSAWTMMGYCTTWMKRVGWSLWRDKSFSVPWTVRTVAYAIPSELIRFETRRDVKMCVCAKKPSARSIGLCGRRELRKWFNYSPTFMADKLCLATTSEIALNQLFGIFNNNYSAGKKSIN